MINEPMFGEFVVDNDEGGALTGTLSNCRETLRLESSFDYDTSRFICLDISKREVERLIEALKDVVEKMR